MGLTSKAMGKNIFKNFYKDNESDIVVALLGNPNVGKSTIFNNMTGMNEHTGNWTGKTVEYASSKYTYNEEDFVLVDLPGTYSLIPTSKEEEVTRDYIESLNYDCLVCVLDATNLERNINLALQIAEVTDNIVFLLLSILHTQTWYIKHLRRRHSCQIPPFLIQYPFQYLLTGTGVSVNWYWSIF